MPPRYPRDFRGYGPTPPDAAWPGGAKIAVSVVLNYEEGGENNILHGDAGSEAFLSDIAGAVPWPGQRHWNMESLYDYGARAGFWRLHRLFTGMDIPVTVYGVATALARNPEQVAAMQAAGWEIASHGLKWVDHRDMPEAVARAQIAQAIRLHAEVVGSPPQGWYTGRCSMNTVRLTAETGAFDWISDSYDDDLPSWLEVGDRDQLVIPYTLEANDMRFATAPGYIDGEQFFRYLKDSFETLYAEGQAGAARMFSIGLHCRLIGRPGKVAGLRRFLDYAKSHDGVWFPTRGDIARHWAKTHPPRRFARPSRMAHEEFVSAYGGIFEQSPWIAARAHALELGPAHDCATGLHNALARAFRSAAPEERLGVLRAHPDLAGKLARAGALTESSAREQAGLGLDRLGDEEFECFTRLNERYRERFGFPFVICVRLTDKAGVLSAFETRLSHDIPTEMAEALGQIHHIACLRLGDLLAG